MVDGLTETINVLMYADFLRRSTEKKQLLLISAVKALQLRDRVCAALKTLMDVTAVGYNF